MAGLGTNSPSGGLEGKRSSPKALPTRLGLHRPGRRLSAKFTITWLVKSLPLQRHLRGYPGLLPQNRGVNIEDMGLPGTLHDLRVPHGLRDQRFSGH